MRRCRYFPWLIMSCLPVVGLAGPIHDRMTLVEAIDVARESGVDIAYSSRLVEDWMLVRNNPSSDEPVAALRQALQAYGLDLDAGPGGKWLVIKSDNSRVGTDAAVVEAPKARPGSPVRPAIEEIRIIGSRHGMFDRRGAADQFLNGEEIQQMPHIADDAFRAVHRLPGVAASDFQAPFNLRGGTVDEVKVKLDGLEIIEPYHMRTLYRPLSVIDPGIIEEAQLLSGGFTAEYGNHSSGVIDISTRRPDSQPAHEIGVSFVSAFARSGGAFADDRGSYFVSARRGYLDLLAEQVTDPGEELQPRYADLYGRLSYLVGDRTDVSLQVLLSQDDVSFVDPGDGEDFGEEGALQYAWLSVDFEPVPGVQSSTVFFSSHAESTEDGSQFFFPEEDISRFLDIDTRQLGVRTDWAIAIHDRHMFRFGARYRSTETDYDYDLNSVRRTAFVNNSEPFIIVRDIDMTADGDDIGAYATWRVQASERWYLEAGLRWDTQDWGNVRNDSQVSPRLNALYQVADRTELRFAWGRYFQPHAVQDLMVIDGDTRFYEPNEAQHSVVGIRHEFASGLQLQADLYDKQYDVVRPRYENLLDIYEFAAESNYDRAFLAPDAARAYGAEFTLRSRGDTSLDWWLSYTWAKVSDDFADETVYRSWDQRHAVTASITWHGDKWTLSAVGRYHSGWPRTPLMASPVLDPSGNVIGIDADLSEWNSRRFDDYSRVDLRASRQVPVSSGSFEFYLEVFNVLNTQNQCCTSNHNLNIGSSVSVSPTFDEYLPLFPSFGFVWKFGPGNRP